jgi:hypothetical protein
VILARTFNPLVQGSSPWRPTYLLVLGLGSSDDSVPWGAQAHHPARARVPEGAEGPRPSSDTLYGHLNKCCHLACTGRPFTEHRRA